MDFTRLATGLLDCQTSHTVDLTGTQITSVYEGPPKLFTLFPLPPQPPLPHKEKKPHTYTITRVKISRTKLGPRAFPPEVQVLMASQGDTGEILLELSSILSNRRDPGRQYFYPLVAGALTYTEQCIQFYYRVGGTHHFSTQVRCRPRSIYFISGSQTGGVGENVEGRPQ